MCNSIDSGDPAGSACERQANMENQTFYADGTHIRYRCRNEGIGAAVHDRLSRQSEGIGFNDDGRAQIKKVVSDYRGKQIIVRETSSRIDGPHMHTKHIGVRGGLERFIR